MISTTRSDESTVRRLVDAAIDAMEELGGEPVDVAAACLSLARRSGIVVLDGSEPCYRDMNRRALAASFAAILMEFADARRPS